ncbi:MAG: TrbI F-type domain-containing protein [Sulfuricellaceae bacterium]|jgi:hypothetical protein
MGENPKKDSVSSGWTQPAVFLIAAVSALVWFGFLAYPWKSQPQQPQVLILDSAKIVDRKMKEVMSATGMTPEKAAEEGRKTGESLNAMLEEYRRQGYIVINASVALAWPAEADITHAVAERLAVKLD